MNKQIVIGVVAGLIVGGAAGYFAPHASASLAGARGQFAGRAGAGSGPSRLNAAFGTITSKDANSITLTLGGPSASSTNGTATGSRIVIFDPSTQVEKTVAGSANDLSVGASVMVSGTPNADGSITAQSIQIRPAGSGAGFGRANGQ